MGKSSAFLRTTVSLVLLLSFVLCLTPCAFAEDQLPESWFDDALFIGDSITGSLATKTLTDGGLGDALILHVNGLSCHGIVRDNRTIPYMGKNRSVAETVSNVEADKLFLMLAMNDIGQTDETMTQSWKTLISDIRELNPDVRIFIQSGTPILYDHAYFTNDTMNSYNELLKSLCEELDCVYVDVTKGLTDENGCLLDEYHLDELHMSGSGCDVWIKNLRNPENYSVKVPEE